jgi:hypothetical protein
MNEFSECRLHRDRLLLGLRGRLKKRVPFNETNVTIVHTHFIILEAEFNLTPFEDTAIYRR